MVLKHGICPKLYTSILGMLLFSLRQDPSWEYDGSEDDACPPSRAKRGGCDLGFEGFRNLVSRQFFCLEDPDASAGLEASFWVRSTF